MAVVRLKSFCPALPPAVQTAKAVRPHLALVAVPVPAETVPPATIKKDWLARSNSFLRANQHSTYKSFFNGFKGDPIKTKTVKQNVKRFWQS
ncbi:MAG: hypothetical protein PHH90_09720 [Limnochordia bacterium]|nr:hypothetical protein [Limnochordia bacterium]